LDRPVGADHDQLLQFMPGLLVDPFLAIQSGYSSTLDNIIHQCGKWHDDNNRLLLCHRGYRKKQCGLAATGGQYDDQRLCFGRVMNQLQRGRLSLGPWFGLGIMVYSLQSN
jgi:hypothetical protein